MRDVAKAAGVSRMTVSRALRKDSPVSPKTRARILDVVRAMNYVPDQMAGSLSTKRSGFVAVLVPSLNNLHFAQTVQALTLELEQIDQQILLGHTDYSMEREEELVEAMLRRRPEAIVLSYDGHTQRTVDLLTEARIPIIELWERPPEPIGHTIGFSNKDASYLMTKGLIARGYKNITFLGEDDNQWTRGAARLEGFRAAMADHDLPVDRLIRSGKPPISMEDGAAIAPALLDRYPDTDCVFCVSDVAAFGVLTEFKAKGLRVPDDIGVAGFGNFEVSRFASPQISTVEVDPIKIGSAAGALIADLMSGAKGVKKDIKNIDVEVRLSFRGSTV